MEICDVVKLALLCSNFNKSVDTNRYFGLIEGLVIYHHLGTSGRRAYLTPAVTGVKVGIIHGQPRLDLPYSEDSIADTDMNVVMTESGGFIEIQGTAEQASFNRNELDNLLSLAEKGIREIINLQNELTGKQPAI